MYCTNETNDDDDDDVADADLVEAVQHRPQRWW